MMTQKFGAPERANLKKCVAKIGDYTDDTERDTAFCNWWGNPLPTLPTLEESWNGEYVLMCTENQYETFKGLVNEEFILIDEDLLEYEEGYGLKKEDVDCVLIYKKA